MKLNQQKAQRPIHSGTVEPDHHINTGLIITTRRVGQSAEDHLVERNIDQAGFIFDKKMMMLGNIGVEITARVIDNNLAQQTGAQKLVERVVNRRLRHAKPGVSRFFMEGFRRNMAVSGTKKQMRQCQTRAG